ncbi:DUF222 domain-containing protein [Pseudarthrobacter sp. TAF60_1]|uniref:HNH endonuclease signature motif containing protein n=1 Tax=Pseudarthrobacter sp. TAF60_1 TaxID=3233071 RepID=UPI003F967FF2
MERRAAVEAAEALVASATALVEALRGTGTAAAAAQPGDRDADPLRAMADDFLGALAQASRIDAQVAAVRVHLAAGYSHAMEALAPPPASPQEHTAQEMAVVAEVACAMTVREPAAAGLLVEARELTSVLPLTLSALEAGSISWQHARIMVDETSGLGPVGARALEAHFLDPDEPRSVRACPVGELVPGRFRAKARMWRERHHPASIEKRHAKCVADRRVLFSPDRDGMAWLSAYLPADTASGIWERTTTAARAMQGPDETRTLTQLRADNVAAWLLGGNTWAGERPDGTAATTAGDVPSPRAQVLVTVPVFALMGLTDEPAMLDGYGPIPPSMARRLVADGAESFHRVLIDPRDGAPLEIGRTSYRVTKAQRQWLRLRDGKCPFPGCNNQSLDNEADHVLAWAKGGATGISNLGQPCRRHHRLRHTTAWTPTGATKDKPPGWISPAGRHYQSEHPDWEPPHWPEQLPPVAKGDPSGHDDRPDDLDGALLTYPKDGNSEFELP